MSPLSRQDRWQHLLQMSFLLEEQCGVRASDGTGTDKVTQRVQAALDDLLEVFPGSLDPNEHFEAFAVRRLVVTLRSILPESR